MTWQPIETAPRDGTAILLWWPARAFHGVVARWPIGGRRWEVCWNLGDVREGRPTHWMPLPAPPEGNSSRLADAPAGASPHPSEVQAPSAESDGG